MGISAGLLSELKIMVTSTVDAGHAHAVTITCA